MTLDLDKLERNRKLAVLSLAGSFETDTILALIAFAREQQEKLETLESALRDTRQELIDKIQELRSEHRGLEMIP